MGSIGHGYGSECHLLRYLGRHRQLLNRSIQEAAGVKVIDWLDFGFDRTRERYPDAELVGLEFLEAGHPARLAWQTVWPNSNRQQNWDGIAITQESNGQGCLLVEAKAHTDELLSQCKAGAGSLAKISSACEATRQAMGVTCDRDWLQPYYQMANRLVTLHHLRSHGVKARLCLIYFVGDCFTGRNCPPSAKEWTPDLKKMDDHLGLSGGSDLERHTHKLFLHVAGPVPVEFLQPEP